MEIDVLNLHHAYLLVGDQAEAEKLLHSLFKDLVGSPDYFVMKEATFGIDASRKLGDLALRKAFTEQKIFLIAPEVITPEAQNALLKTFEEPIAHTHFFLLVRDEGVIIPTLRSRMRVLHLSAEGEGSEEARNFSTLSIKERLAFVKKFVDKERNLSTFLDELLLSVKTPEMKKILYHLRLVSDQRGASARLILEHLSVML